MTKSKDENSYRSILKGVSLFGSVKALEVLVGMIRVKFVALILGPEGMGITSLFNSAATPIQQFSSLGLNLAIVQEVASNRDNPDGKAAAFATARRLITFTAILGALVCLIGAPWLSMATFGSYSYTWQFMLLSLSVYFAIGGTGRLSMLQGLHEVKRLSKASFIGGLTGLIVGVPLYYIFHDKGIVPAIVAGSLAMYIFYSYNLRKCEEAPGPVRFVWQEHKPVVKRLIILGIILMASNLIGSLCTYVTNIFIRWLSGESTLGLFQAVSSVTTQYSGMVFTAMAMDYFPRLTAVAPDNSRMHGIVNRQTEIMALVIAPVAIGLILTAPWVIRLLYTDKFLPATPLMCWMGLVIMLKALMFPMGYIAFAKNNKRLFFWLEGVFGNVSLLLASCLMFYFFGLIGLGYGMVIDCALSYIVYYVINRRLYGYNFDRKSALMSLYSAASVTLAFAASFIPSRTVSIVVMAVILAVVGIFSISRLRVMLKSRA